MVEEPATLRTTRELAGGTPAREGYQAEAFLARQRAVGRRLTGNRRTVVDHPARKPIHETAV